MLQRILILCTANSARSQMAEGLLRHLSDGSVEVHSAGTKAIGTNPLAIEVMQEIGVDISAHRSKSVAEFSAQSFDTVITVCDSAAEQCPSRPGAFIGVCSITAVAGSSEEKRAAFRSLRNHLASLLRELNVSKSF